MPEAIYFDQLDGVPIICERFTAKTAIKPPDFTLMQFTGLHDKNGKEIWEGDLIKHDNVNENLEVYFCGATGQWNLGKGERRHYYGPLYQYPNNLLEIVGNVYVNSGTLLGERNETKR